MFQGADRAAEIGNPIRFATPCGQLPELGPQIAETHRIVRMALGRIDPDIETVTAGKTHR